MLDTLLTAVLAWDQTHQLMLALGGMALTAGVVTVLCDAAMRNALCVVRGYPPVVPEPPEPQWCNHDDNIRGVCLAPGGCKTVQECCETMRRHNGQSAT